MRDKGNRAITAAAVMGGAVVLALSVSALLPATPAWVAGAFGVLGWLGIMLLHEVAGRHYQELRLIRAGLEAVRNGRMPPEALSLRLTNGGAGIIMDLAALTVDLAVERNRVRNLPDQRMASVIAAMKNGVVVVTDSGLVSLINAAGKLLLGAEKARVGTSVYAALDRERLLTARAAARDAAGSAVDVDLRSVDGREIRARIADFGEYRGAVITFPAMEGTHPGAVEVALDLHDSPPMVSAPDADTLVSALPVTVLDTETTGLDVRSDRIVSVAAVRMHGARMFRSTMVDLLVDPERRIPQQSTAIHGITDAMVKGQPTIDKVLPNVQGLTAGTVLVGHNIGFDLAMMRRQAQECGLAWTDPLALDTLLLMAVLFPDDDALDLDSTARILGVDVSGRHTALGDVLVTAEIWARQVGLMQERGVRTLGEAMALAQRPRGLINRQKEAGW